LKIHQEHVEAIEHRLGRLAGLRIQAVNGNHQLGVEAVGRLHHIVLLLPAETMLRSEQAGEILAVNLGDYVARRDKLGRYRGRMHQQSDSATFEPPRARAGQYLQTGMDPGSVLGRHRSAPELVYRSARPSAFGVWRGRRPSEGGAVYQPGFFV